MVETFLENPAPDDMEEKSKKFKDFNWVKKNLRARLVNEKCNNEIRRSAKDYGFEDLIIVPVINVSYEMGVAGSIKVTQEMLNLWEVTADEVFEICLNNSKENGLVMRTLRDELNRRAGVPVIPDIDEYNFMYMITVEENNGSFGAISAILMQDELKEKFPNGYYLLPCSIHECIVFDKNIGDGREDLTEMVKAVNADCVSPEDVLSDHAYTF